MTAATPIKIDADVPLPMVNQNLTKYPFREMEIGNSFFLEGTNRNLRVQASYAKRVIPNSKFAVRTVTENGVKGTRVWRLA